MHLPFVSRAKYLALADSATTLQDKIRALEAKLEVAESQAKASALEAREAVRLVADWLAEQQFGKKIFGSDAPTLPTDTPLMDVLESYNNRQGRKRARDLVREGEQKFLKDFREAAEGLTMEASIKS